MEILTKILALIGFGGAKAPGGATSGTEVMHQAPDLLMSIQSDYLYNRSTYRALVNYSLVLSAITIILIAAAGWIIISANPQDRFFVATVDGRISRVIPLDSPIANNTDMYVRVGLSVAATLTFGFLDFEQRKAEVGPIFEPEALTALYDSFLGTNGVNAMTQNNYVYVTEVEPSRPGGVVKQGVTDNIYQWVIQVPLLVIRKVGTNEESKVASRWTALVLVERARSIELTRGFTVTRLLALQQEGGQQQAAPQVQGVTP